MADDVDECVNMHIDESLAFAIDRPVPGKRKATEALSCSISESKQRREKPVFIAEHLNEESDFEGENFFAFKRTPFKPSYTNLIKPLRHFLYCFLF